MVIGKNITFWAHDHAGAKAGRTPALRRRLEAIAEETPEERIFHEWMGGDLDLFTGENIHHGWHGSLRGVSKTAGARRFLGSWRRCFLYRHHGSAEGFRLPRQEFGPQGGNNKKHRKHDC